MKEGVNMLKKWRDCVLYYPCSGVGSIAAIVAMATTLFRPKKPDPGRFGGEASCIHTLHYAPIQIPHVHGRVFLKVLAGVAQWRLSLTWEPEVERKRLIEFLGDPH